MTRPVTRTRSDATTEQLWLGHRTGRGMMPSKGPCHSAAARADSACVTATRDQSVQRVTRYHLMFGVAALAFVALILAFRWSSGG